MKYLLIAVLSIIIIWMLNIKIIEGDTTIPNASGKIETGTIQDMRDFLEKMYSICLLNPNDTTGDKTKNTNCFKVSILGAYLWPTLAGYTKQSLEDLSPIYGKSTEEKSLAGQMAEEQDTTPQPVPILLNDTDYQLFLQLAILGRLLQPFTSENWDNYNSAVIWFKDDGGYARDGCKERWGGYEGAISLVDEYLRKITLILGYFHSQTNSNTSVSNGDSVYTSMYSSYK
jgi:hypothetical protein